MEEIHMIMTQRNNISKILIFIIVLFNSCSSKPDVGQFVSKFNDNNKKFVALGKYISDSIVIENTPALYEQIPRIVFINNSGKKNPQYKRLYKYLEDLNIYSLSIEKEHCEPLIAFDKYYLKVNGNSAESNIYYLFDYCLKDNKDFENENVKYIKLDNNWSLFIEK